MRCWVLFTARWALTEKAVANFALVASSQPSSAEAQYNLARALVDQKSYQQAIDAYGKAIAIKPDYAAAWSGLATSHNAMGARDKAIATLRDALGRHPQFANLHILLGRLLFDNSEFEEAERVLASCIQKNDKAAESILLLGCIYFQRSDFEAARDLFRRVVALAPDDPVANNFLGSALQNLGVYAEAEVYIRKAYAVRSDDAEIVTNLGLVLQGLGQSAEAEVLHRRAIELNPNLAGAWNNLGVSLQNLGQWDEALRCYNRAISLKSGFFLAITNKAHALLALGRLSEGWGDYVHRFDKKTFAQARRPFTYEMWAGPTGDKARLLIWTDQGLGDEVLYASMLNDVSGITKACVFECAPRMVSLFQRSFPNVLVVPRATPPDPAIAAFQPDKQISLSELGQFLRPSLEAFPQHTGYLQPDEQLRLKLKAKYQNIAQGRRIVGLSWKSENPIYGMFKSIPLEKLAAVLSMPNVIFVSLQYGKQQDELAAIKERLGVEIIVDPEIDAVADPDASAAQLAAMDLVITTSNTTAHFAGAMNVPVWTMAPAGHGALWYWFVDRKDSPWYPSMQIFRQTTPGDWAPVIHDIKSHLQQWAAA